MLTLVLLVALPIIGQLADIFTTLIALTYCGVKEQNPFAVRLLNVSPIVFTIVKIFLAGITGGIAISLYTRGFEEIAYVVCALVTIAGIGPAILNIHVIKNTNTIS